MDYYSIMATIIAATIAMVAAIGIVGDIRLRIAKRRTLEACDRAIAACDRALEQVRQLQADLKKLRSDKTPS